MTKNFSRHEFECKDGCGADNINPNLVAKLQKVRDRLGMPMKITSGVRCEKHNILVGGDTNSSHLEGNATAVDIACDNSSLRYQLISCLISVFNRVGIAEDFIHVDIDPDKPAGVVWTY